ncbi:MAG: helix-hairpin-helix domain-containing protein [Planctomycetota bacterium]|jgi:DNA polymerase (family 10)
MAGLTNKEIARIFREIEILMGVLGEDSRRAMTYGRTSRLIEGLPDSAADLAAAGKLGEVRGIGPATQAAVAEIVDRGSCELLDELAARVPPGVPDILRVPGLGPKKVHTVVNDLGVTSLEELQAAAADGRLAAVKGFGAKSAQKVLEGIAFLNQTRGFLRTSDAYAAALGLAAELGLQDAVVAGAARRGVPMVDTIALVAVGSPDSVSVEGATLEDGIWTAPRTGNPALRIRLVDRASFARALFEETGPADHVASVLGRDGLDGSEEEIYSSRGLHFVPPERRHACDGTEPVPTLVTRADLRGMVHTHTTWSDGTLDLAGMADAAHERGYEYLVISDHSRAAAYAGGLSIDKLMAQGEAILAFNETGHPVRLLRSSEVDILPDGSLDYPDDVLAKLDVVIASVHSSFGQDEETMTARIVGAVQNPRVDILGHMTGMLRGRRGPYAVNVAAVLEAAAEAGTCVELNASPWRLDLDPDWHARAVELGIGVPIDPDAHSAEGMDDNEWGALAARHGGLRPEDVPNTRDVDGFLGILSG